MTVRAAGSGVVVANFASVPEIPPAASALAAAGRLARYCTPFALSAAQEAQLSHLPSVISRPILGELRRRPVPPDVPDEVVRRLASASEVTRWTVARSGFYPAIVASHFGHQATFDHCLARTLSPTDEAVLTVAEAAKSTLRTAHKLGIPTFLDCPLAHHRYVQRLMREEARITPRFASTLQMADTPRLWTRRLDEELALADHILVFCDFERATYVEAGVAEAKLIQIPLGVDLTLFSPRARLREGTFRVLFVGQITQRKGISYLVEGFRRAGIPNSELLFVGNPVGSTEPWVREPGVKHLPARARARLPEVYAQSDVCVLPSLVEGFGLTPLEAMACGLPVIVSEHTFGPDVVQDGGDGYVVPIRDPDAIAERLRHLWAHPEQRQRMGLAARRRAEELPWARYGRRVADAITSRV